MTRQEALAEAQKRWGDKAWVASGSGLCVVGQTPNIFSGPDEILGSGPDFESAFRDADARSSR